MSNSIITVSYKINDIIGDDHIREFFEQMALIAKKNRSVNLIMEIYHIDELRSINSFLSDTSSKKKVLKHLRKFALIANSDWMEELGDFIDYLTGEVEVEIFDQNEKKLVKKWVQSPTIKENRDLKERLKQGYAHLLE